MSIYRLIEILPSKAASDLAELLSATQQHTLHVESLSVCWVYEISRTKEGGFKIVETIGKSTDSISLYPPINCSFWRSDAYPAWLESTYDRLRSSK